MLVSLANGTALCYAIRYPNETNSGSSDRKGPTVYVVIRSYSGEGASELFDLLAKREEDVKKVISGVPGFVSYVAFRAEGGGEDWGPGPGAASGMTVTVSQDKAGADESTRRAADWVEENVSTPVRRLQITEGSTVLRF